MPGTVFTAIEAQAHIADFVSLYKSRARNNPKKTGDRAAKSFRRLDRRLRGASRAEHERIIDDLSKDVEASRQEWRRTETTHDVALRRFDDSTAEYLDHIHGRTAARDLADNLLNPMPEVFGDPHRNSIMKEEGHWPRPEDFPEAQAQDPMVLALERAGMDPENSKDVTETFFLANAQILEAGVPFFWASDIVQSVQVISRSVPDWTFWERDLPERSAFWWFESPVVLGDNFKYVALGWTILLHQKDGSKLFQVHGLDERRSHDTAVLALVLYGGVPGSSEIWPKTLLLWSEGMPLSEWAAYSDRGILAERTDVAKPKGPQFQIGEKGNLQLGQFLAASLQFLKQRVLVVQTRDMTNRGLLRRAEKRNRPTSVQVVQLRRAATKEQHTYFPPDSVDWSCRWLVSGHWRNQWYPSTQTHQLKFIEPYVKGPDWLPLRVSTKKVYAVVR